MRFKIDATALIALKPRIDPNHKNSDSETFSVLEEFVEWTKKRGLPAACSDEAQVKSSVTIVTAARAKPSGLGLPLRCRARLAEVRFNLEIHEPKKTKHDKHQKLSGSEIYDLTATNHAIDMQGVIRNFVIACNLALPGSIHLSKGLISISGTQRFQMPAMTNTFEFADEYSRRVGWPPLTRLPLNKVLSWYSQESVFGHEWSDSRVSRALNAITYLFSEPIESTVAEIFWALVGLEALYGNGKENVMRQVMEKSCALLGQHETHKKDFSAMYDFRSRLIHGDIDFPSKNWDEYDAAHVEAFNNKWNKSHDLAIALLLASIQELIKRDWHDISFAYAMQGSAQPFSQVNLGSFSRSLYNVKKLRKL